MSELDWVTLGDKQIAWMDAQFQELTLTRGVHAGRIHTRPNAFNHKIMEIAVDDVVVAAARMDEEWS